MSYNPRCGTISSRLMANDTHVLQRALAELTKITSAAHAVVNPPEPEDTPTKYVFLGVQYDHSTQSVRVAEKTRKRLNEAEAKMRTRPDELTLREALACFGLGNYAATISGFDKSSVSCQSHTWRASTTKPTGSAPCSNQHMST